MAFNEKELEIIKFGKESGKSRQEVERALFNFRNGVVPKSVETGKAELLTDIKQTGSNLKQTFQDTQIKQSQALESGVRGEQGLGRSFAQAIGIGAGGIARGIGDIFTGGVKAVLPQEREEQIKTGIETVAKPIMESSPVQSVIERYNALDEQKKRDVDALIGVGSLALEFTGLGAGAKVGTGAVRTGLEAVETGLNKIRQSIPEGKVFKSFDELVGTVDNTLRQDLPPLPKDATPSQIRARAELEAPILSFKEKAVGLTPDVKKQIQGKSDKMAEYLDVVNARNLDINNPSALEYGGNRAREAVTKMEEIVQDTGSDIGSFRNKVATYKATPDQIKVVENTFTDGLSKLNLELRNGLVQQIKGKPTKVGAGDIKALNNFAENIRVIKQDPNLKNLIEVRDIFSQNLKFGQRVGEVSDLLDPLSKQVRAKIKETGANIVGKSEAQRLADYSDFIEALGDIRSYTDRNAGGEYLLRVLLSGRGGEARSIVNTIKKYTGIDLTDDAVMSTLVTDMLGNQRQKNLFAQEITKAGLDTARILSGDPKTILERSVQFAKDRLLDTETVLKEASK